VKRKGRRRRRRRKKLREKKIQKIKNQSPNIERGRDEYKILLSP